MKENNNRLNESRSLNSPHVELLSEQEVVVEVGDGAVHGVTVSHLHHGCTRFTLHELYLEKVTGEDLQVWSALEGKKNRHKKEAVGSLMDGYASTTTSALKTPP